MLLEVRCRKYVRGTEHCHYDWCVNGNQFVCVCAVSLVGSVWTAPTIKLKVVLVSKAAACIEPYMDVFADIIFEAACGHSFYHC